MKIITVTNLYPRPDKPQLGVFNKQLFDALAEVLGGGGEQGAGSEAKDEGGNLKPERRSWEETETSNNRLFDECTQYPDTNSRKQFSDQITGFLNICLVPEWRIWKWKGILSFESGISSFKTIYLPVFYLPLAGRSLAWWFYLTGLRRLRDMFRQADAVFSTWLYPDGVAASLLAAELGLPSWIMVQGSDIFHLAHAARRRKILEACAKAAGIVCVAQHLADKLIGAGVPETKVYVIPNGVDRNTFQYRMRQESLSMLSVRSSAFSSFKFHPSSFLDKKVLLFVGSLAPVKRPDLMLDAFAQLKKTEGGSSFILLFLGDGPMRGALERQASSMKLADSMIFLGFRPHEEVALWMNVADCLCLTSESEGCPNVVLEALASGLPAVATDAGAVREMLKNEPAGKMVEDCMAHGARRLAQAIAEILAMNIDRKTMAERHAAGESWQSMAEKILGLMRSV